MSTEIIVIETGEGCVIDLTKEASIIVGMGTFDIQTTCALLIVGKNKTGLFHIGTQTDITSIIPIIDLFGGVVKKEIVFNGTNYASGDERIQRTIMGMIQMISMGLGLQFTPDEFKNSSGGLYSVLFEKDATTGLIIGSFNLYQSEIDVASKDMYPNNLRQIRTIVHKFDSIFGNSLTNHLFPIDIIFDNTIENPTSNVLSYSPIPRLQTPGLQHDLLTLKDCTKEEKLVWMVSDDTIAKYPHIGPMKTSHSFMIEPIVDELITPWLLYTCANNNIFVE